MGRRRRRKTPNVRVQRRLPKIFTCPHCGKDAIRISYGRDRTFADVSCGACKIQTTLSINSLMEAVDIYGDFVDRFDSGAIKIEPPKEEVEESNTIVKESAEETIGFSKADLDEERS